MVQIKILDWQTFEKKYVGLVNEFIYGIDILNDTNMVLNLPDANEKIKLSDLLIINSEVFKITAKKGQQITFNSILEYFNEELFVTLEDNIFDLLNNNYLKDNDTYKRLTWLKLSEDLKLQKIKFEDPLNNSTSAPTSEFYNIKKLVANTIIANKLNLSTEIDYQLNKINLLIAPTASVEEIRLDSYLIGKPTLPVKKVVKNALEIKQKINNTEGVQTALNYKKMVLLKDNTVADVTDANPQLRILPVKYGSYAETVVSGEERSIQQIAEEQLLDTNEYYTSFSLDLNRLFNTNFAPKVGDFIKIHYADYTAITRVTSIKCNLQKIDYICGYSRMDIIYVLKQKGVL